MQLLIYKNSKKHPLKKWKRLNTHSFIYLPLILSIKQKGIILCKSFVIYMHQGIESPTHDRSIYRTFSFSCIIFGSMKGYPKFWCLVCFEYHV